MGNIKYEIRNKTDQTPWHLDAYLDELKWRFNNCDLSGEMHIRVMSSDDPPKLAINILEIAKSTARIEVELAAHEGGNQSIGSDELYLKKVDGQCKIIWE